MIIILAQRIDFESEYLDELYSVYHFPAKYKNQIHKGDIFVYYQGDRYKREHRYYFGTGVVGTISTKDNKNYYAELTKGKHFTNIVPIYCGEKGYIEQKGFLEVRKSLNPPWQSSVRPLSEEAYRYILSQAGGIETVKKILTDNVDMVNFEDIITGLKNDLKKHIKDYFLNQNDDAISLIITVAEKLASTISKRNESLEKRNYTPSKIESGKSVLVTNEAAENIKQKEMKLNIAAEKNEEKYNMITTEYIKEYIMQLLREAKESSLKELTLVSGEIHKKMGLRSRLPSVCDAMYKVMKASDEVLNTTPSGKSSTIKIKYYL